MPGQCLAGCAGGSGRRDTWGRFFSEAERDIGALVYPGMFMAEDIGVHRLFAERARAGVRIRLLLGDPDNRNVSERGEAEGIDEDMAAKVKNSVMLFRKLLAEPDVELRLHGTVLYNSIYRADDQVLVNTHIYGIMADNAPVFHLCKIPGEEMTSTYWTASSGSGTGRRRTRDPSGEPPDRLLPRSGRRKLTAWSRQ